MRHAFTALTLAALALAPLVYSKDEPKKEAPATATTQEAANPKLTPGVRAAVLAAIGDNVTMQDLTDFVKAAKLASRTAYDEEIVGKLDKMLAAVRSAKDWERKADKDFDAGLDTRNGAEGIKLSLELSLKERQLQWEQQRLADGGRLELRERLEQAELPDRQEQSPQLSGKLTLTSEPQHAEIFVDGKFAGNAPASLTLPVGKHKFRVVLSGYKEWTKELELIPDSDLTLAAKLVRLPKQTGTR